MQETQDMQVQSLSWEDPLEEEMAIHPLQYSCLENPIDRGDWRAKVHEITELDTAEVSEHICVRIIYFCLTLFLYW